MEVRNCIQCGKIFRPIMGRRVCSSCAEAERAVFDSVKAYLRNNPRASVMQVSQETGVPANKIREYVKEGRLVSASDDWNVTCERCGKAIDRGRFCAECSARLGEELHSGTGRASAPGDRGRAKVHWDRYRRR